MEAVLSIHYIIQLFDCQKNIKKNEAFDLVCFILNFLQLFEKIEVLR